jgi:hypothetical protein
MKCAPLKPSKLTARAVFLFADPTMLWANVPSK